MVIIIIFCGHIQREMQSSQSIIYWQH